MKENKTEKCWNCKKRITSEEYRTNNGVCFKCG